jgi:small subunit ribosomal protein S16
MTKGKANLVAVRIRMKRLGRKHRSYFRIVAIDSRQPRDGRTIEELGSYDPMVKNTDERVKLKPDRIKYWLSVGALPSERVATLFQKYMAKFEQQAVEAAAAVPSGAAATAPSA